MPLASLRVWSKASHEVLAAIPWLKKYDALGSECLTCFGLFENLKTGLTFKNNPIKLPW